MQRIALHIAAFTVTIVGAIGLGERIVMASDDDGDAKAACQAIGTLMKEHRIDDMKALISAASNNRINVAGTDQAVSYVNAWLSGAKEIEGPNFLADKDYAGALHRAWFLLLKDGIPLYLECESIRISGRWDLTDFNFDTDRNKVSLP